jgi:hypothetical protein
MGNKNRVETFPANPFMIERNRRKRKAVAAKRRFENGIKDDSHAVMFKKITGV